MAQVQWRMENTDWGYLVRWNISVMGDGALHLKKQVNILLMYRCNTGAMPSSSWGQRHSRGGQPGLDEGLRGSGLWSSSKSDPVPNKTTLSQTPWISNTGWPREDLEHGNKQLSGGYLCPSVYITIRIDVRYHIPSVIVTQKLDALRVIIQEL